MPEGEQKMDKAPVFDNIDRRAILAMTGVAAAVFLNCARSRTAATAAGA